MTGDQSTARQVDALYRAHLLRAAATRMDRRRGRPARAIYQALRAARRQEAIAQEVTR